MKIIHHRRGVVGPVVILSALAALALHLGCSSSDDSGGDSTHDAGNDALPIPPPPDNDSGSDDPYDSGPGTDPHDSGTGPHDSGPGGPDLTKDTFFNTTSAERMKAGGADHTFDDIAKVDLFQASYVAHHFCSAKGFASGHPTGYQDLAHGLIGVICLANDSYVFDANPTEMANVHCGSTSTPEGATWAAASCIANRLCTGRTYTASGTQKNYVGGIFTGEHNTVYQTVCLKETAAIHYEVATTDYPNNPDKFSNIDTVTWHQGARAAAYICQAKGRPLAAGFYTGEHSATVDGVNCY